MQNQQKHGETQSIGNDQASAKTEWNYIFEEIITKQITFVLSPDSSVTSDNMRWVQSGWVRKVQVHTEFDCQFWPCAEQ